MKTRLVKLFFFWTCFLLSSCTELVLLAQGHGTHHSNRSRTPFSRRSYRNTSNISKNVESSRDCNTGAEFSKNKRTEAQNIAKNQEIYDELTERQCQLFSSCLDYSLENISKPETGRWLDGRILYIIKFDVVVMLDINANNIINLQKQKVNLHVSPQYLMWRNEGNDRNRILEAIFTKFKIVDNIDEYWFDKSISYIDVDGQRITTSIKFSEIVNAEFGVYKNYFDEKVYLELYPHSKSSKLNLMSRDFRIGSMLTDLRGKPNTKDEFILKNQTGQPVNWRVMSPNRCILRIPLSIAYSLEEIEKISSIYVVLR